MADSFQFDLVSHERLLMSEEVAEVVVPGSEGYFGVLKDHAPFMSTIRPGFIEVTAASGEKSRIFIRGGFADTGPGGLTILAEQAIPIEDLNAAEIERELQFAQEDLDDAKTDEARQAAQTRLDQMKEVQVALKTV
jgi:F-type H+-transporting ATPase subunit epsilon